MFQILPVANKDYHRLRCPCMSASADCDPFDDGHDSLGLTSVQLHLRCRRQINVHLDQPMVKTGNLFGDGAAAVRSRSFPESQGSHGDSIPAPAATGPTGRFRRR